VKVAVVGAGVVGLSTVLSLLEFGADVACYEAAAPMSQRSSGASRIFRLAHGSPELVELAEAARRTYAVWSERAGAELVGGGGTAIAGPDVGEWSVAMSAAGAPHRVEDGQRRLGLPDRSIGGPVLFDPAGGVIDAGRIGEFLIARTVPAVALDTVYRIELLDSGTRVWSAGGRRDFDACVLVAGAATCSLAAQVELYTPSALFHHVRLTFPLADPARRPPCLIDKSESWRPGFTTYQHLTAPGKWAVGAHFDPADTAWELGRDRVVATSRRLTVDYVRQKLDGVEDRIVDELYCTVTASWGDGYGVQRNGGVLTLYGDNLFKLAPVLGQLLADAALSGSTPKSIMAPSLETNEPARRPPR